MVSIWKDLVELPSYKKMDSDVKTDVLVIGGGLAGILCAYMLEKEGVDYILVEADRICSGVTGFTTAKITAQHGLIFRKIYDQFGYEIAKLYLEANQEAVNEYKKICINVDCDFETKDNFVYTINNRKKLDEEFCALQKIGSNAELVENIDLPIDTDGAISFRNQAQFNPLKFVNSIIKKLTIYENTKVLELAPRLAITDNGNIYADKIIVATHYPFINKHGAYFLKQYQFRSYVVALKNAEKLNGMYVDGSGAGLSFRNYKEYLILGGGGHRTGKTGENWEKLRQFARNNYPESEEMYYWATQDCMTLDNIPYIGKYGRNTDNLWVTTGFGKWGMTTSMVSALILCDAILDKKNKYEDVFNPHRHMLRKQLLLNVCESTSNLLRLSKPRCSHLGCALRWNNDEHSWDCPCHGSRFSETGELINNPATDDITNKIVK